MGFFVRRWDPKFDGFFGGLENAEDVGIFRRGKPWDTF